MGRNHEIVIVDSAKVIASMLLNDFLNSLAEAVDDDNRFSSFADTIRQEIAKLTQMRDTETELAELPAQMQFWLAKKADLELYKRSIERQLRLTSIPKLAELLKKSSNYVSNKVLDAALESLPEYSHLTEILSRVNFVIDLVQSGITSLWFKRDALINLSANRRRQLAAEQFDF